MLTKLKAAAIAVLAFIAAVLSALLFGWWKGRAAGEDAAQAAQAKQAQRQTAQATEQAQQVQEVKGEIDRMPDAPALQVDTADPGTAAGELRDDWNRDAPG